MSTCAWTMLPIDGIGSETLPYERVACQHSGTRPHRIPAQVACKIRSSAHHRGMSVAASPLAHAYHQRLGAFVSDERLGDWRLKLYGLAAPDKGVRPELLERTRELAARSLPAVDDRHHGAAFAIAHDATLSRSRSIYWWQDVNELHSAHLRRPARRLLGARAVETARRAASGSSGSSSSSAAPGSRT